MNGKRIDRIINILYAIAAILVLLGAFFRLQHYPHGNYLLLVGVFVGTIAGITNLVGTKSNS